MSRTPPEGAVIHSSGHEAGVSFLCGAKYDPTVFWSGFYDRVTCPRCMEIIADSSTTDGKRSDPKESQ